MYCTIGSLNMKLYDNVKLEKEIKELAKKGIHQGYIGLIVKIDGNIFTICFYNPYNLGEYAFAKVNKSELSLVARADDKVIAEMKEYFGSINFETDTSLSKCDIKEYDKVELLVEKPEYAVEGVHKGAYGCVWHPYAIEGKWSILFYNVGDSHDKEVEISVRREDFRIIS